MMEFESLIVMEHIVDGNLGYAYVYEIENSSKHIELIFDMMPENRAYFIGKNAYMQIK